MGTMDRPSPCRRPVARVIVALLCLLAAGSVLAGRLEAWVPHLANASAASRAAFAEAAALELAAAYRAAARAAGSDAGRWAAATRAYVQRLEAAARAARTGAPVRVLADPDGSLRVVVGRRPARQFSIAAPRAGGTAALERAILEHWCGRDACAAPRSAPATAARALPFEIEAPMVRVPGAPAVAAPPPRPRYAAHLPTGRDGLACASGGRPHARLVELACGALATDLNRLAVALHGAALRGIELEWERLAPPRRSGTVHRVVVNGRGEVVTVDLPALARAPEVLRAVLPWLAARLAGEVRAQALDPPAALIYGAHAG